MRIFSQVNLDNPSDLLKKSHMPAKRRIQPDEAPMTRRGRQLMDVIYRRQEATAREILDELPDAPSYSTVRTLLNLLVNKGHLLRNDEDRTHLYRPARQRAAAAQSALRRLVRTFFDGSVANAVSGLLSLRDQTLTAEEIARLEKMIAESKKEESP